MKLSTSLKNIPHQTIASRLLTTNRTTSRLSIVSSLTPITSRYASSTSLPKVAQPSLWSGMIPKFLRKSEPTTTSPTSSQAVKPKEWNPATFFIIIFLLIGSQAIRMLALRHEFRDFTLKTDARIELLREVIEKVKAGEAVDVERILGTGDEAREQEWEEVLKQIEREDVLWNANRKRGGDQRQQQNPSSETSDASPKAHQSQAEETVPKTKPLRRPGFY